MSSRTRPWTLAVMCLAGCYTDPRAPVPFSFGDASLADVAGTQPLGLTALNGMWTFEAGQETFGPDLLIRNSPRFQSGFTERETAAYVVTRAACVDGARVVFEGEWNSRTTLPQGLVRLELGPPEAATSVCQGRSPAPPFTLRGTYGVGRGLPMRPLRLSWTRPSRPTEGRFLVGAHHGRCQAGDGCGVSENSLPAILGIEAFGADLIELDVNVTRDGVPFLYHDPTFNPRLVRGIYCHGDVTDYTLLHMRTLCHALYGEVIPTLEEALTAVVERTNLHSVWLDVKNPAGIAAMIPVIQRAQTLAAARSRAVLFFLGLPDDESIDAFLAQPEPRVPCLIEVNPRDIRPTGCTLWGPRWTRGPLPLAVRATQLSNIHVMPWTLDDPAFLDVFLQGATPNGILTDYPGLVWRRYEAVGQTPVGPPWP